MSQNNRPFFNGMKFMKNVKHSGKPKHEANQFIYDKFLAMRDSSGQKQNTGAYHCYSKILKTLEKYPMPILNAKQALELEGVGPKTAAVIANLITKHYANKIEDPSKIIEMNLNDEPMIIDEPIPADDLLEHYNQHSQDIDLRARIKEIEKFIEESPAKVKRDLSPKEPAPKLSYQMTFDSIKRIQEEQPDLDEEEQDFEVLMSKYFSNKKTKSSEIKEQSDEESDDLNFMLKTEPKSKSTETGLDLFSLRKDSNDTKNASKKKRYYKPDANSTGAFILISIKCFELETTKKYASKKDIKDQLKKLASEYGTMEIKSWNAIDTLTKNELLVPFKFNEEMKYSLSLSGKTLADELATEKLSEIKSNSSMKIESENSRSIPQSLFEDEVALTDATNLPSKPLKKMKSNSFENDDFPMVRFYSQENIPFRNNSESTKSTLFEIAEERNSQSHSLGFMSQSLQRREKLVENYEELRANSKGHYAHKIKKNTIKKIEITLYVDNRELKNKVERNFIFDKLVEAGVKCKSMSLPLGDFFWVVDVEGSSCNQTYTLDYIVERKTADDLASSIMDNRYSQQKFRLKNSKIKNVFYLIEGKATQSACLKDSALQTAMLHTQILSGFKVRQTVNLQDTIKWLILMSNSIEAKLMQDIKKPDCDYLEFQYNYDEYQVLTAKNNMNIKILFGNMMRQIKGCGRETIHEFLDKFDSFNDFYTYFTNIQGEETKLEFLGQKQKKSKKSKKEFFDIFVDPKQIHLNKTLASHVLTLFTADVYPKVLTKDSIKFHEDTTL